MAEAVASNIGNILTLLVEHSTAVNYRVGGAEPNFSTAYNIVKVANSHQFGWSQKHEAAMPVEGWWDSFETEQREEIFAFFGRAIHYGILTEPKCAISRRFLESLKWFAEGIVDKMPESKLVKFTVAIEFLVCSGIPEPEQVATGKIKSKFVSRSRALAFLSGFCPEPPNYLNYGQLYDQRSDIVHGRHIQQERQRWQTAHRSEMHARWAIMGALYFFGRNNAFGSSKLSEVQTSKVFDDLIKWYNETKKMGA